MKKKNAIERIVSIDASVIYMVKKVLHLSQYNCHIKITMQHSLHFFPTNIPLIVEFYFIILVYSGGNDFKLGPPAYHPNPSGLNFTSFNY